MKIDLPSGNWCELRPVAVVSERQRRPIKRALAAVSPEGWITQSKIDERLALQAAGEPVPDELAHFIPQFSGADVDAFSDANDLVAIAMIAEWSYGTQVSLESLLDLPGPDYDAIRAAVAPFGPQLLPNFAPSRDPASPTEPSDGSETSSEGSAESPTSISLLNSESGGYSDSV